MAPLIDDARAACDEARRLRLEAGALRFAARRKVGDARVRLATADARRSQIAETLHRELPSPWSALLWRRPDDGLDRALSGL